MQQNMTFAPEDEQAYQAAEQKKMLANLLMQRGLQGAPPIQQGRIVSKQPLMAMLGPLIQGTVGAFSQKAAEKEQTDVKNRAATTFASGVEALTNAPNRQIAITSALGSGIPGLRSMAEKFRGEDAAAEKARIDAENARLLAGGKIVGDSGDVGGALRMLSGGKLGGDYKPPMQETPQIQFQQTPDGKNIPYALEADKYGRKSLKFGPAGTSVTVDTGTKQESAAATAIGSQVPKRLETITNEAKANIEALANADRIQALAKDPQVITGFGANVLTGLSSLGARLGFNGPEAPAKTQTLLNEIATSVLGKVKQLTGAISNQEMPFLKAAAAGDITWEPQAIQRLADVAKVVAHNDLIDLQDAYMGTLKTRGAMESGADQMYPFPKGWRFEADPKKYKAQREDGFSKYDYIANNPAVQPKTPAATGGGGFRPPSQMTRAEKLEELKRLKGQ